MNRVTLRLKWWIVVSLTVAGCTSHTAMPTAGTPRRMGPPNILFAISDDQSWLHAGAYGDPVAKTPAFDRVAREGALFRNAFHPSPGCSPSRASILTGRHTWQIEEAGTHASGFSTRYRVYPDILEEAGYAVGYTGKGWGPGDWKKSGRKRNPAGRPFKDRTLTPPNDGINANDYAGNFVDFLKARPAGKPFLFWFGGNEPHRAYAKGAGLRSGKRLEDVVVPPFLPDTPEVRSDLLDYALEIEWFDQHLGRMLRTLEDRGELDNTLVVVTSDNGMPFVRAKANCYEYGVHAPLAIRWPARMQGGRTIDDVIGLVDLAPTFLQAAGLTVPADMTGRGLMDVLTSQTSGQIDAGRTRAFFARERHSSSRHNNAGYPIRGMRTPTHLYLRNLHPEQWPAGHPAGFAGEPFGFYDVDPGPSKIELIQRKAEPSLQPFFELAFGKRPPDELYEVVGDPGNLHNLAQDPAHEKLRAQLAAELDAELERTGDTRKGADPEIWESYPRYSPIRVFPAD